MPPKKAGRKKDADGEPAANGPIAPTGGTLRDVPSMHEPGRRRDPAATFDRGVGLDGYDRHTGVDVPTHPVLRLPGHAEPIASPFGEDHAATEATQATEATSSAEPPGRARPRKRTP